MRFAISSATVEGAVALVGGAELHHMRDVMRLAPGAEVALFDERGAEYAGTIRSFQARHAVVEIAAAQRARAASHRRPCPGRGGDQGAADGFPGREGRRTGRGGTMAGAVRREGSCARSAASGSRDGAGSRPRRPSRAWRRVATEVIAPLKLGDLIRRLNEGRLCVVLSAGAPAVGRDLREARKRALLLLCGPEGDFTDEELAAVRAAGFLAAGLGGRRLRSETAALAALSIAAGALDELDGAVGGED